MDKMDPEQFLKHRDLELAQFYDEAHERLTEEERKIIFPIQHSLCEDHRRYEKMSDLAVGGMKRVFTSLDRQTDRIVVYAEPLDSASPEEVERFLYEARITAHLEHTNIIPVHDMGIGPEGVPYFTMKLISGESLSAILKKVHSKGDEAYCRKYALTELLALLIKVCDAVAYAHSKRVLHLDIKPENIQVGHYGDMQLCDWGLARFIGDDVPEWDSEKGGLETGATWSGRLKGSPGFMAPEQAVEDGRTTEQTDVYGLGAVLYYILTGSLPINGGNANEVLENTRRGKVVSLHSPRWHKRIPTGLAAVTMKALSLDPAQRYDSADEFRQELSRYLHGFPTEAENAGLLTILRLFYRRNPIRCNIVLVAIMVINLLIAVSVMKVHRERQQALQARDTATQNLQLYQAEQQQRQQLEIETQQLVSLVQPLTDYTAAESLIRLLERGIPMITNEQERNVLWGKKAAMHFVLQEFNAAYEIFEKQEVELIDVSDWTSNRIQELSRKFAELKPDDAVLFSEKEMRDFLKILGPGAGEDIRKFYYFTLYHHRRRTPDRSPQECLGTSLQLLDLLNPARFYDRAAQRPFTPHGDGYHLDLSHCPYIYFSVSLGGKAVLNALAPLNLRSLDLSDSMHVDYRSLFNGDLRLEELRITGAKHPKGISTLNPRTTGLKRVFIDPSYEQKEINNLSSKGVEVIVVEDEDKPGRSAK